MLSSILLENAPDLLRRGNLLLCKPHPLFFVEVAVSILVASVKHRASNPLRDAHGHLLRDEVIAIDPLAILAFLFLFGLQEFLLLPRPLLLQAQLTPLLGGHAPLPILLNSLTQEGWLEVIGVLAAMPTDPAPELC